MANEQRVDLNKEVFSRNQYPTTINTDLTEFGLPTLQQDLDPDIL